MQYLEAAVAVLGDEGEPLHWTRIQDLALRRGYLDPFTQPEIRRNLLSALADGVKSGELVRGPGPGIYALGQRRGRVRDLNGDTSDR